MKTIFENQYCKLMLRPLNPRSDRSVFALEWFLSTENMDNDDFEEMLTIFAGLTEEYHPSCFLVNLVHSRYIVPLSTQEWHDTHIVPRFAQAGIKKMAFVLETNTPIAIKETHIQSFDEENARTLVDVQFFNSMLSAVQWLTED